MPSSVDIAKDWGCTAPNLVVSIVPSLMLPGGIFIVISVFVVFVVKM